MGNLLIGLFLAAIVAFLFCIMIEMADDMMRYPAPKWWSPRKFRLYGSIIIFLFASIITIYICRQNSYKYIQEFSAEKYMIEESLNNDFLSGFERAELVRIAAEKNAELAGKQYHGQQ